MKFIYRHRDYTPFPDGQDYASIIVDKQYFTETLHALQRQGYFIVGIEENK